jgi:threonine/homoserine/homoserine lactone efflux protein
MLCSVYFLAAATPGPSQFFILEQLVLRSKRDARWGALGVSLGTMIWVFFVIAGLGQLLSAWPEARRFTALLSIALLLFFVVRNLREIRGDRSALKTAPHTGASGSATKNSSFVQGLLVNLLNPNSVVFFMTLFAPLIATGISRLELGLSAAGVALISLLWYQLIAESWRLSGFYEFLQKHSLQLRLIVCLFYIYWAARLVLGLVENF